MYNIIVNIVHKIACNTAQCDASEQYSVQFWSICSIILCAISENILCNITNNFSHNIAQYISILYMKLLTVLLTYCSIYFNIVHIAHIARVLRYCTYYQYCTKLLDIVQNCSILLVATRVVINCIYCQYCSKLLKIVQYMPVFLGPSWAKCRLLLLCCLLLQCMLLQCCQFHWLSYYSMNSQQPFVY